MRTRKTVIEEKETERYEEEYFVRLQRKRKSEGGRGVSDSVKELTDFGDIHALTDASFKPKVLDSATFYSFISFSAFLPYHTLILFIWEFLVHFCRTKRRNGGLPCLPRDLKGKGRKVGITEVLFDFLPVSFTLANSIKYLLLANYFNHLKHFR